MRVLDAMNDCVVFVGRILRKGSQEEARLTGTAFIVSFPDTASGTRFLYLVTAQHVAKPLVSGGEWFIRFNSAEGGTDEVRADDRARWWTHPDPLQAPSVDAAVTPLPLPATARQTHVPVEMFLTDKVTAERAIGQGSEVFITGLFTKMAGRMKNIPIMRMGNVAMMPSERIPNIRGGGGQIGESEVYLVETRSLGGISGSPAFVVETVALPERPTGRPDYPTSSVFLGFGCTYLLGLMSGHWLIRERESNDIEIESVRESEGSIATGISIAVPAKKILEILNHPELEEMRRARRAARAEGEGTSVHTGQGPT
jgi:hypothetical protein